MRFKKHLCIVLILLLGCASNVKNTSESNAQEKTDWKINHPVSSTHFIGIGSAKVGSDIGEAQKIARNRALEDMSSQIKVKIESRTIAGEITIEINKEFFDSSVYIQNIRTFTDAILEGVEIARTDTTPDGYYWVEIILDKNKYFSILKEKVNNARQIALDALIAAEKSDPVKRVYELQTALKSIEDFKGNLLRCSLDGTDIILNTEILRRMRQTLSDFSVKASVDEFEAGSIDSFPDSIGFYVLYQNTPVEKCQLHWSTSHNDVKLLSLPEKSSGFYPVRISSLSSSAGKVTVTASVDFSSIIDDLKKAGLKAPVGKFIVSRKKPSMFLKSKNAFTELLADELSGNNILSLAVSEDQADFILSGSLVVDSNVTIQRSIFQASGVLDCSLTRRGDAAPVGIRKNITTGSGKSAEIARQGLIKEAIDIAIKKIKGTF